MVKRLILTIAVALLLVSPGSGADLAVELRFDPTTAALPTPEVLSTVRMLRPIRIQPFSDSRSGGQIFFGELKIDGQQQRVLSKTAVAVYATEAFRKVYGEWGGRVAENGALLLKGEVTDFALENSEGYQARVGFHFFLTAEDGRILWDGHSSGIVRGSGRALQAENLSGLFSDILRETYTELLADEKLVGVWSGKASNTYFIKEPASLSERRGG